MPDAKRYSQILLLVALTAISSAVALSFTLDPYRVAHPLLGEFRFLPNNRVPKLRFLSGNCVNYDAYFVGDSRSATLSARDLASSRGYRFYNLSTPSDDVASITRRLEFLLQRGCPVSTVILDESVDVLLDDKQTRAYALLLRESPMITRENWIAFYSRYFLSIQSLTTYYSALHQGPITRQIYYQDGHADYQWGMPDGSSFLSASCAAPSLTRNQRLLLPGRLAGYRELARLAQQYRFRLLVWIAPLNRRESSILDDPDIATFLHELAAIPGLHVIEAERDSALLADFHYWHDCGHFRRELFDQLVAPAIGRLLATPEDQVMVRSRSAEMPSEPSPSR